MIQTLSRFAQSTLSGRQAVTATAVALPDVVVGEFILKASSANLIPVYVGPSTATAGTDGNSGMELYPGDILVLDSSNLKDIYVIAASTGAYVYWYGKTV